MIIGSRDFRQGKTFVCGILNLTPDSFSDGGKYNRIDAALARAEEMRAEGADLIDIGGESTRPGFTPVSAQEEAARVIPVIEALKTRIDLPLSVDTRKAAVAGEALEAGADMVNDVSGLLGDPDMAGVIARSGAACCLMHAGDSGKTGNEVAGRDSGPEASGILGRVTSGLRRSVGLAQAAGIAGEKIILDPGIGFGKNREENLQLIAFLGRLREELGFPLLLGASRKSVIGQTLGLAADERLEGTLVTTVFAVLGGCLFVRVHDVQANVRAVRMAEAILAGEAGKEEYR